MAFDNYNLLVTNEGSNSDSAHHTAFYYVMQCINGSGPSLETTSDMLINLYIGNGNFKRHPNRPDNQYDFSRDQYTGLLAMQSVCRSTSNGLLVKLFHKAHPFIFNNSYDSDGTPKAWWDRDIMDPATYGLYWRAINKKTWLRYFTDLHVLISTVLWLYQVKNSPSRTSDENIQLLLVTGLLKYPTPIIKFAAKYYFKHRPDNNGGQGWKGAVKDFWDRDGKYLPEVVEPTIQALSTIQTQLEM